MKTHRVEILVDGRRMAMLYAKDFWIVADKDDIEMRASVEDLGTHPTKKRGKQ